MAGETATISGGGFSFTIFVTSVKHGLDKQLMILPIPNKGNSDTRTILVDLRRCKEAVTISGYLLDTASSTGLSQATQIIRIMRETATNLSLTWGAGGTYESMTGNIEKADISEEPTRLGPQGAWTDGELAAKEKKSYNIMLVFVRGEFRG